MIASLGEASGYVPYTAFSAKKSYLEEHGREVESFVKALKKGMDYVEKHSAQEIAEVIQPQFAETKTDTLTTIVDRYKKQDTWKSDLTFEEDAFVLLENILEEAGELPRRVDYNTLVTKDFIQN